MSEPLIQSYRDLRVWQESMALAESCYRLAVGLPKEELYGLSSQIKRAAASIPANIAEGHGRENTRSFVQYLRIAQGSLKELETHLLLAERLGLLGRADINGPMEQCEILGRRLRSLIRSLQRRNAEPSRTE